MSEIAISVSDLGKQFVVGGAEYPHQSFREMLTRTFTAPLVRLKRLRGEVRQDETFWALRDLNFEIRAGELVGVIGRNGAGKSTLLKILSRITPPTRGQVMIRGRVASLLEVGTGFHPELTGRENIFLNGAILGMRHREIEQNFDEIVAFAEIEKFLDTPVKRYSSGMYVRLAFAIAAHLDPDILVIDEVLAVGDAAFQSRCLGKLKGVAGGGRTVVFVSHNMGAVQKLTESIVWLDGGRLCYQGEVREGINCYLESLENNRTSLDLVSFIGPLNGTIKFLSLLVLQDDTEVQTVTPDRPITLRIDGESERLLVDMDITVSFYRDGLRLFSCHDAPRGTVLKAGCFTSEYILDAYTLRPGRYSIGVGGRQYGRAGWIWCENVASIVVVERWDDICQERDEGLLAIKYSGSRVQ